MVRLRYKFIYARQRPCPTNATPGGVGEASGGQTNSSVCIRRPLDTHPLYREPKPVEDEHAIRLIHTLVGAVLIGLNLPPAAPSWPPAAAAALACVPVRARGKSNPTSYVVPVLSALAAALGPLALVLPGPWNQCTDAEYIGVVITSTGLALHAMSTARPRRTTVATYKERTMSSVRNVF